MASYHVTFDLPLEYLFALSLSRTMTYATLLDQANETARRALAMYTNGDTIVDIPHEQVRAMDDELQGNGAVQCAFFIVAFDTFPFSFKRCPTSCVRPTSLKVT